MSSSLERIKEYIDYKGLSISAFEKSIGLSNGSFSSQLKKGKTIGVDKLENILISYSDLSPNWVLTGVGEMINEKIETVSDYKVSREEFYNHLKSDTDWLNAESIKFIIYDKIKEKDASSLNTFKKLRETLIKLVLLINSIDQVYEDTSNFKIYEKLKKGISKNDIERDVDKQLKNIDDFAPLIEDLINILNTSLNKFKPYDLLNSLESEFIKERNKLIISQDYQRVAKLEGDLKLEKKYII